MHDDTGTTRELVPRKVDGCFIVVGTLLQLGKKQKYAYTVSVHPSFKPMPTARRNRQLLLFVVIFCVVPTYSSSFSYFHTST
jgi:hypothetical protein